jgi:putative intracellular protease/amidase
MLIAQEKFHDEELLHPKEYFEGRGHKMFVAAEEKKEASGMLGASIIPDYFFGEVEKLDFDALVIVGSAENNQGTIQTPFLML